MNAAPSDRRALLVPLQATDCPEPDAEQALERSGNDAKLAILMILTGQGVDEARAAMTAAGGLLRRALEATSYFEIGSIV